MFKVREAQPQDFEAWSQMRAVLWPSSSAQQHLTEIKEFYSKNDFQAWLALKGSEYAGFAEASIRSYANGCDSHPVVFFEGVWVAVGFRRSGLGREFIQAVELWAKSKGIFEVGSDAELANSISHLCHKKWGFEETERVIYYRKKLT